MPHPTRPVTDQNYRIYSDERHCENCIHLRDCWSPDHLPIVKKMPGMFFPRTYYNYIRVEHLMKRNIGGWCQNFIMAENETRVFGEQGEPGWDK